VRSSQARPEAQALYAFDLIELNGDDLRREPSKSTLASVLPKAALGLRFNQHIEVEGPTVFAHACKVGLEGIVSKQKGSPYRSGRSPDWLKMKNPTSGPPERGHFSLSVGSPSRPKGQRRGQATSLWITAHAGAILSSGAGGCLAKKYKERASN